MQEQKDRTKYFQNWFPIRNNIDPVSKKLVKINKNYTNTTLSYMTLPSRSKLIMDEIKSYFPNQNNLNIVETCSGLGGMTLEFLDSNVVEKVYSFERDPEYRKMFLNNIDIYKLGNKLESLEEFTLEKYHAIEKVDVLYIDPPCLDYPKSGLKLGDILLEYYPKFILNAHLIIFHVPLDYELNIDYQGYKIDKKNYDKMTIYYLIRNNCHMFSNLYLNNDDKLKKLLDSKGHGLYNIFEKLMQKNSQMCDSDIYQILRENYRKHNQEYKNSDNRAVKRANELYKLLGNPTNKTILDIGCGDGSITSALAKITNSNIYGCDIYDSSYDPDKFIKLDEINLQLPFSDHNFDIIIALMSLHHIKQLDEMISEIKRTLKPNGILLIREHDFNEDLEPILEIMHGLYSYVWADETDDFCNSYFSSYKNNLEWDKLIKMPIMKKTQPFGDYNFYYTLYKHKFIKGGNQDDQNEDLSKKFELLRLNKSQDSQEILKALGIVHDYIIKNKLIVAGGMSIDCALRLKGLKLYPDDALPDYDFFSPNHAANSYEVAQILCENGFTEVDVINATHVTTMRVRVCGVFVADITYIPNDVFKDIMTLEYKGMRVLHPYYIIMDQYDSLSNPYKNAPREVINQRWKKDVVRLELLQNNYKFPDAKIVFKTSKINIPQEILDKPCGGILVGWVALAYYNSKHPALEKKYQTKWSNINCTIPVNYITIMTDDYKSFIPLKSSKPLKHKIKYMNMMVSMPRHVEIDNLHILDTKGYKPTVLSNQDPYIGSLTIIMWYLINRWLYYGKEPVILAGINNTIELMNTGDYKLDIITYGAYNWNEQFVYYIRNFFGNERDKKPMMIKKLEDCKMPENLKDYKFNYQNSDYFQIDGSETTEFEEVFPLQNMNIKS